MESPSAFLFFGPSGSGKGTQANLIKEYLEKNSGRKSIYIETGGLARKFNEKDGYTNKLTREVLEHGGLFPEFFPIWIWSSFIIDNFTGEENLIADGLSRRVAEAPILANALEFYRFKPIFVIFINVNREWSFKRLTERGREDDTESSINRRLDWYYQNVVPAIAYFEENQNKSMVFFEINGEQTVEKVHEDIVGKIKAYSNSLR
ncbi:MAG: nucleoside monophosphate kinase [bacterium]|nr:nucleoside monophosphate kinase [bacterium]